MRAQARDAIISPQLDPRFPVIPVRALSNQATKDFMIYQKELIKKVDRQEIDPKEAQLQIEHFWAGALRRAVIDGDTDRGSLMAGQSVGMVTKEQSTREVIEELLTQAQEHQLKLQNFQKQVKQAHEDKQAKHQYLQRKIHEFEILTQKEILTREIYHEFLLNVFRPQIDFYFLKKEIKIKKLEENILHLRQSLLSSTTKEMKNIIKKAELAAGEFEQNTFMLIEALESDLADVGKQMESYLVELGLK